jgi:molybdopterin-guanine dinucleotide biosynthesis protein A
MTSTVGVGAVVLAGGRSSRFGRDKLVERIGDRPLLALAVDAVSAVAADVVVVAHAPLVALPEAARVVTDPVPFEGPLAGLATGLRALEPGTQDAIVVGGDMPTLVPAVLARLLEALDLPEQPSVAVLADDERPRPLPMAIRRDAGLAAVDRLLGSGERRLRALLDALPTIVIPPDAWRTDDPTGASLLDVDVPEDLPGY